MNGSNTVRENRERERGRERLDAGGILRER